MNISFNDIGEIKEAGFVGFKTIAELLADNSVIPKIKGVYFVLYIDNNKPELMQVGTGGYFKGKNPNISISELEKEWVEGSNVIYIGKAGSETGRSTLNSRLRQYFSFGQGKGIGHWGGRLIWQLKSARDLVVCWKPLVIEEPREIEAGLIRDFVSLYGKRPFANLRD